MSDVFNTPFEVSLRVLLVLEASPREWFSADWIAAADFITIYGKDFGIVDENLHGENNYRYSEFALRRELIREALKSLASRNLIHVRATSNGFAYALSKSGGEYCAEFESEYAQNYRDMAAIVRQFANSKSEREILSLINRYSVSALQRSY